jgi:hypothetical protein
MQITITGPRAGGSTILAIEIAKILAEKGINVDFISYNPMAEQFLRDAMSKPSPKGWKPSRVVIVEGIEPEDESGIRYSRVSKKRKPKRKDAVNKPPNEGV